MVQKGGADNCTSEIGCSDIYGRCVCSTTEIKNAWGIFNNECQGLQRKHIMRMLSVYTWEALSARGMVTNVLKTRAEIKWDGNDMRNRWRKVDAKWISLWVMTKCRNDAFQLFKTNECHVWKETEMGIQLGIAQKRVWVVFRQQGWRPFQRQGPCSFWRSRSFCTDCSGALAIVQALLCAKPQNLPGHRMALLEKHWKAPSLRHLEN